VCIEDCPLFAPICCLRGLLYGDKRSSFRPRSFNKYLTRFISGGALIACFFFYDLILYFRFLVRCGGGQNCVVVRPPNSSAQNPCALCEKCALLWTTGNCGLNRQSVFQTRCCLFLAPILIPGPGLQKWVVEFNPSKGGFPLFRSLAFLSPRVFAWPRELCGGLKSIQVVSLPCSRDLSPIPLFVVG